MELQHEMERLIEELGSAIPAAFESEDYPIGRTLAGGIQFHVATEIVPSAAKFVRLLDSDQLRVMTQP